MELVLKDARSAFEVSETIFGCEFNKALVHQVVIAYMAGSRQGTRAQKKRSEVSGSGKKPWRQKGTGRARAGTIRSPLWRGGGVTFAAQPQNHRQKVNTKMYRAAIRSILSELIRQDRLVVVRQFDIEVPKTKILAAKLKALELSNVLIIAREVQGKLLLASRNLCRVDVCNTTRINPVNLITFDKVLITAEAVKQIEEWLK